jgi:hypothetical protein
MILTRMSARYALALMLVGGLAACSDNPASSSTGISTRKSSQSPGDTSVSTTPPEQQPPSSTVTLAAHVGVAVAGPDTLQNTPLAGAVVTVYRIDLQRVPGATTDTLQAVETEVGSATTNSTGDASVADLAQAVYRIEAVPPAASGLARRSLSISGPYRSTVNLLFILRPAGGAA